MIQLCSPSIELAPSFIDFAAEMRAASHPEAGLVAETTYWAVRVQGVVGRISLRHSLTDKKPKRLVRSAGFF